MNPIFEIEPKEIEALSDLAFVDLMNHLLNAEANKIGISPENISLTLKTDEPDGGIDARTNQPIETVPSQIPPGLSIWQFKSGTTAPGKIIKEFLKPGVQAAIRKGGTYCLVEGKDYGDRARQNRKVELSKLFRARRLRPKFRLFNASALSMWASGHPSMALLPYFSRPGCELMRFEKWADQRAHIIPFQLEPKREKVIAEIRAVVKAESQLDALRIEGLAGVGKTRLVMEAIRDTGLEEDTLYATSSTDIQSAFFTWIESHPNVKKVVLVVDECDTESAQRYRIQSERTERRVKLITIGQRTRPPGTPALAPEGLFILEKMDDKAIEMIVSGINPGIPPEAVRFIIRVSSGYVKLAAELANAYLRNRSIVSAADLARAEDVRIILEGLIPDDRKRKGMEAISLLTRAGWEGDLSSEGRTLADFMNVDWGELQELIEGMRKTGLVVRQGRYRYVTPHLLAIWLASEVWDARGEDITNQLIGKLPSLSSRKALLERLADLGDNEIAQHVVEKLLSEEGIFPDLRSIDATEKAQIFSILAESYPRVGLDALDRIIMNLPRDSLQEFGSGRREIIFLLEKLVWLPETFLGAARILLALAEAENESYANNATGIWAGLFRTHLGGTAVPAVDRHRLIDEILSGESRDKKVLALKGLEESLSIHESRTVSGELYRGRLVPPEWHPTTIEDDISVRKSALSLLARALEDVDITVSEEARNVLSSISLGLVQRGLASEIVGMVMRLEAVTESQKYDMRNTLETILEYDDGALTREQREKIETRISSIIGKTFHDRLIRWVGKRSRYDWSKEGRDSAESQVDALAVEALQNPGLLLKETNWLVSSEAENAGLFSFFLGKKDTTKAIFPELVKIARDKKGSIILSGYLEGRAADGEADWREGLLDEWAKGEPALSEVVFDSTRRAPLSERAAKRIILLIETHKIDTNSLKLLMFGSGIENLPLSPLVRIVSLLEESNDISSLEAALSIMGDWIKAHPEELSGIDSVIWKLVGRYDAITDRRMVGYYWQQIADRMLEKNPLRIASAILKALHQQDRVFMRDEYGIQVLVKATQKDPKKVWEAVAPVLLKKDDRSAFRLLLVFRGWYGELFDSNFLIEWAKEHSERGPSILAEISNPGGAKLGALARLLLINFPGNAGVESSLRANFLSGVFWGSEVSWYAGKLENVKSWMDDPNDHIKRWAKKLAANIEENVKRARQREEEEDLL
jgi:hypothetical protein